MIARVLIFVALFAANSMAYTLTEKGWTTSCYPTATSVRFPVSTNQLTYRNWNDADAGIGTTGIGSPKDIWVGDHYHALFERARSANRTPPASPVWYRSERTMLVLYKGWIFSNCSSFLNPYLRDADGSYSTSIAATAYGDYTSLVWTVTGLMASVSAPTNYLANTPWRDLAGSIAGRTDTYAYGSFTLADYGWKWLRPVVSQLYITARYASFGIPTNQAARKVCQNSGPVGGPFGSETCVEYTNFTVSGGDIAGVYATDSDAPIGLWGYGSETWRVNARCTGIYTNREPSQPLINSIDIYFAALADEVTAGCTNCSSTFSGPYIQASNRAAYVRQIAGDTTTSGTWGYVIADYEPPPAIPDPPRDHFGGYYFYISDLPLMITRWSYNY